MKDLWSHTLVYCPKLSLYTICRSKKIPQEAVRGYRVSATSLQEEPIVGLRMIGCAGFHTIKIRAIYDSNVYDNKFKEHTLPLNYLILKPELLFPSLKKDKNNDKPPNIYFK